MRQSILAQTQPQTSPQQTLLTTSKKLRFGWPKRSVLINFSSSKPFFVYFTPHSLPTTSKNWPKKPVGFEHLILQKLTSIEAKVTCQERLLRRLHHLLMKTTPTMEVSLPVSEFYMLPLRGDQELETLEYLLTDKTHFTNLVGILMVKLHLEGVKTQFQKSLRSLGILLTLFRLRISSLFEELQ